MDYSNGTTLVNQNLNTYSMFMYRRNEVVLFISGYVLREYDNCCPKVNMDMVI